MKDKISKRDWETISAYLDGQLSPRKQARLETRLQADHQFQILLDELRNTRHVLRNVPRLRAPRSFMLTPEMAGQPTRLPRLAPIFGWASAVASFLLVLVLVGDFYNVAGYIPVESNIPQQEAYSVVESQGDEYELPTQPPPEREMDVSLKGSAEEAAPSESSGEVVPMEVAAAPVLESAPTQEIIPEPDEIEMFAAAEVTTTETHEGRAGTTDMGDESFETAADISMGASAEKAAEPQEDSKSMDNTGIQAESRTVSETIVTESIQEQPEEILVEAESPTQDQEQPAEPQTGDEFETLLAAPQEDQVELPTAGAIEAHQSAEPTSVGALSASETSAVEASNPENLSDFEVGVEVILALFVLGTGLAWFFMRRGGS
ncbi:hypothetical protein ACFLXI_07675 [Chloroflexota bacterium]